MISKQTSCGTRGEVTGTLLNAIKIEQAKRDDQIVEGCGIRYKDVRIDRFPLIIEQNNTTKEGKGISDVLES